MLLSPYLVLWDKEASLQPLSSLTLSLSHNASHVTATAATWSALQCLLDLFQRKYIFFCLRMRNNLMMTLRVIYWLINSYWTFLSKMHWKYYFWYKLVIYSVKLVWYVYDMQGVKHLVFLKCSDFFRQFWLAQAWRTHTDTEGNGRLRVLVPFQAVVVLHADGFNGAAVSWSGRCRRPPAAPLLHFWPTGISQKVKVLIHDDL